MARRLPGDERCKDCSADREPGKARCAECLEKRRAAEAVQREERRERKKCITCGRAVKRSKTHEYRYCPEHLEYYRAHFGRYRKRLAAGG